MAYTDIDNPELYFQTKLYTGNGGSQSITLDGDTDMQPDMIYIKERDAAHSSSVIDSVRGVRKTLTSDENAAEITESAGLSAFDSDGFSFDGVGGNHVNDGSQPTVAWCWKAGTAFTNDASSTSVGSIDSAGSVSTTAGFSIISYTGTGSVGTVAHGLGAVPKMILFKNRSRASNWLVYHEALGNTNNMYLDAVNATHDRSNTFNDTSPTSSVFTVGTADLNISGDSIIAYCFADVQGYSKFGSYTGNGNADGTFIYTGFKPAFVMTKPSNKTGEWFMIDNKRDPSNYVRRRLKANSNAAENTDDNQDFDILSNGFKARRNAGDWNSSGDTFIYMAFAENPFVTSTGVPATAR